MRIREYRLAPGERVACTIRADDDAVVSRMQVPLAGVKRVDALQSLDLGDGHVQQWRVEDVPFDPDADEMLSLPSADGAEEVAGPYVPRPTRRGGRVGRAVARRVHVRAYAELIVPPADSILSHLRQVPNGSATARSGVDAWAGRRCVPIAPSRPARRSRCQ